jgi:hypothetical protein
VVILLKGLVKDEAVDGRGERERKEKDPERNQAYFI